MSDISKKKYFLRRNTDGFGSQYQSIMSSIALCSLKNYEYIHFPFLNMDHVNNEQIESLNKFIGVPFTGNQGKHIDIIDNYSNEVHWSENPSIYYTDDVLDIIRKYYYTNEKPSVKDVDIAIHIRRGDVNKDSKIITFFNGFGMSTIDRYTSNEEYIKLIKFIKEKHPGRHITIFSQGNIDEFKELQQENVSFELDTNLEETFHSLVTAKILVTSKSSFSYTAAILNTNKIYFTKFWHYPLKHWEVLEKF